MVLARPVRLYCRHRSIRSVSLSTVSALERVHGSPPSLEQPVDQTLSMLPRLNALNI